MTLENAYRDPQHMLLTPFFKYVQQQALTPQEFRSFMVQDPWVEIYCTRLAASQAAKALA